MTAAENAAGRQAPRNGGRPQIPEIDELVRKGQEQLRVLMGGRGGGGGNGTGGGGGPAWRARFTRWPWSGRAGGAGGLPASIR